MSGLLGHRGLLLADGVGDPLAGLVALHLHMDGANASTTFIDSSAYGQTCTAQNTAAITTSQSVFGGACGNFTGNNDARVDVTAAASLRLIDDFAIEFRLRMTSVAAGIYVLGAIGGSFVWIYTSSSGQLGYYIMGEARDNKRAVSVDTWYDIKLMRSGSTRSLVVDGSVADSYTETSHTNMSTNCKWQIGATPDLAGSGAGGRCYMDEFRLTIGAARSNAVAGSAFPDS